MLCRFVFCFFSVASFSLFHVHEVTTSWICISSQSGLDLRSVETSFDGGLQMRSTKGCLFFGGGSVKSFWPLFTTFGNSARKPVSQEEYFCLFYDQLPL